MADDELMLRKLVREAELDRKLPRPFTDPDLDVSSMSGFYLNPAKLHRDPLFTCGCPITFLAGMNLRCAAWQQVPAGSLPSDWNELAHFARLEKKLLKRLAPNALSGFFECTDGRLYHLELCADALNADRSRKRYREMARVSWEKRRAAAAPKGNFEDPNGL